MQDKQREQRRHKRMQKVKGKRAGASRPAAGGPTTRIDPDKGREWPPGECYVTLEWDEPGAVVDLVFSRARADGVSVAALFSVDRSGPGLLSASAIGGLRQEHVTGESGRISERTGRAMVGCAPGLVAALIDDAKVNGTNAEPARFTEAYALLDGIPRLELHDAPFGPAVAPPPPEPGLLESLKKRLFG
ncbi:MAG: hypothetical protein ABMA64_38105 [Myxococcota bacterium]